MEKNDEKKEDEEEEEEEVGGEVDVNQHLDQREEEVEGPWA